jgi:nanoRNase/pAp phosphatase (c-di-AMP/oligoRNAs hydrolase)
MTIKRILKLIEERQARFILLLCHQNADADALCSAYAFQGLLKRLAPSTVTEIGTGQGISKLSKHILDRTPIIVNTKPNVESADLIILLDTNTIEQLGELTETVAQSVAPLIVIDHHAAHPETLKKAALTIIEDKVSSNCEVVYKLFKQTKTKPNLNEATALFLGIAFDTRHFVLGSASTFEVIVELCHAGVNPQQTLPLLSLPMDMSERIARIKACKITKIFKTKDWIIAFSQVSAYEASAARALVDMGAHAVAVAGQKNGRVEISLRCTRDFNKETGIHLGVDIAQPLGEYLQGMGGGHAAAAGANGKGKAEKTLLHCKQLFKQKLSQD